MVGLEGGGGKVKIRILALFEGQKTFAFLLP